MKSFPTLGASRIAVTLAVLMLTVSMTAAAAEPQFIKESITGGFTLKEPVKLYDAGSLYEYINGQAVFYLSYRFVVLEHGYYGRGEASYYVDVYELGSGLSAFGAFRQQRESDAPPLEVGTEGAVLDYLTTFYKGKYYVEIIPMGSGTDPVGDMKKIAAAIVASIPGDTKPPAEVGIFPKQGLVSGSERYMDENLISYSFMGRGLVAQYNAPGADKPMRVFISYAKSATEAGARFDEYKAKLKESKAVKVGSLEGIAGSEPYRGTTLIVQNGSTVVGCLDVADVTTAAGILATVITNLK